MTPTRKQALSSLVSELDGLLARLDDMIREEERGIKKLRKELDVISAALIDTTDIDTLIEATDMMDNARDRLENITV